MEVLNLASLSTSLHIYLLIMFSQKLKHWCYFRGTHLEKSATDGFSQGNDRLMLADLSKREDHFETFETL